MQADFEKVDMKNVIILITIVFAVISCGVENQHRRFYEDDYRSGDSNDQVSLEVIDSTLNKKTSVVVSGRSYSFNITTESCSDISIEAIIKGAGTFTLYEVKSVSSQGCYTDAIGSFEGAPMEFSLKARYCDNQGNCKYTSPVKIKKVF